MYSPVSPQPSTCSFWGGQPVSETRLFSTSLFWGADHEAIASLLLNRRRAIIPSCVATIHDRPKNIKSIYMYIYCIYCIYTVYIYQPSTIQARKACPRGPYLVERFFFISRESLTRGNLFFIYEHQLQQSQVIACFLFKEMPTAIAAVPASSTPRMMFTLRLACRPNIIEKLLSFIYFFILGTIDCL